MRIALTLPYVKQVVLDVCGRAVACQANFTGLFSKVPISRDTGASDMMEGHVVLVCSGYHEFFN